MAAPLTLITPIGAYEQIVVPRMGVHLHIPQDRGFSLYFLPADTAFFFNPPWLAEQPVYASRQQAASLAEYVAALDAALNAQFTHTSQAIDQSMSLERLRDAVGADAFASRIRRMRMLLTPLHLLIHHTTLKGHMQRGMMLDDATSEAYGRMREIFLAAEERLSGADIGETKRENLESLLDSTRTAARLYQRLQESVHNHRRTIGEIKDFFYAPYAARPMAESPAPGNLS